MPAAGVKKDRGLNPGPSSASPLSDLPFRVFHRRADPELRRTYPLGGRAADRVHEVDSVAVFIRAAVAVRVPFAGFILLCLRVMKPDPSVPFTLVVEVVSFRCYPSFPALM